MTDVQAGELAGDDRGLSAVPTPDEPELLLEPREGLPPVVADPEALAATVTRFARGSGPVAVDAERASGYRYGQRAYLVQLRRAGAGTALIDPIACPDLSELDAVIAGEQWVLHAATQDMPCLAEVGMAPRSLFDTELAGRLAGFDRVGLGAMVERVLGIRLEKGHSAADWSRRPLPEPWLRYAALDVEVLVELRDALEAELDAQGKLAWAHEEFEAIVSSPPREPRNDPWRRTSGIHRVRNRRQLAAVRALWHLRDSLAAQRDIAPGRLLPDAAIVAASTASVRTIEELAAIAGFTGRGVRRHLRHFLTALHEAAALPDTELPHATGTGYDGPPPASRWADRDPAAAARLVRARAAVGEVAEAHNLPVENLLAPDLVRRLAWSPPEEPGEDGVRRVLLEGGARAWQVELTAGPLSAALAG